MKVARPTVQKAYIYVCLLIGTLISLTVTYLIFTEEKGVSNQTIECESAPLISTIMNIFYKCSLAFLAGGILSDFKFIKIGQI
jgi:hypothetical protein